MKISCQSCQAKYTIADDKVLGRIVKIRCKRCRATIVVNGNDPPATGAAAEPEAPHEDEREPREWTVNVADGDQRTMTEEDIAAAYRSGLVNDETYCWQDGMADWAILREVPALLAACTAGAETAGAASASPASLLAGSAAAGAGTPMTARRAAGGRAPIADLFGGAAQAGGEDDVMTSAPAKLPQPDEAHDPQKLTGARNENSVLFSLPALTGPSKGQPIGKSPDSEASGLIDIRQLSARFGSADDGKKSSRVDDIMNLSGGGFSPVLTAPVLSAPTIDPYAETRPAAGASVSPGAGRSRGLVALAVATGALVIVGAVGGAASMMRKSTDEKPVASAAARAAKEAPGVAPDEPSSAASAQAAAATNPPPEPSASGSAPEGEPKEATAASREAENHAAENHAAESHAPENREPKAAGAPPREGPVRAAASPAESDQPFNMGEAKARLGAAAEGVQPCKRGDVTGTGHVIITFAPSGAVQSAAIDGPPFEGTAAGACVVAHFRGVRVPAFGGSPFKVRKSFTIN